MEQIPKTNKLNIAITGCIHGHLNKLYTDLQAYEQSLKKKIHLVLCTGDFEVNIYNSINFTSVLKVKMI